MSRPGALQLSQGLAQPLYGGAFELRRGEWVIVRVSGTGLKVTGKAHFQIIE